MLVLERRDLLLDIRDRLLDLYVQRDEAGRAGDWQLANLINEDISEIRAQRAKIYDRDDGKSL